MIRYGLIGAGMMGHEHLRNIALIDGATVSAVADPHPAMLASAAKLSGAEPFADWRDMLSADRADVYVIAAPNDTHHHLMLAALPTNKPILCEKPLATTSAHCAEILAAARARTAPTWVAMEYRYMPPVQAMLDTLPTLGALHMLAIREHRFPFLPKIEGWNRHGARTGGTLVEKCCHFFDLMRLILGADPVRIYASGGQNVNHLETADVLDNAFVIVDFAGGARAVLDLCMFAEGTDWQESIIVTGDVGRIQTLIPSDAASKRPDAPHARLITAHRQTGETGRDIPVDPAILAAGSHHGSTFYQHQRFFDLVRTGAGTPEVSVEDGLWSVRMGEAAEASARTGQAITLEPL